MFFERHASKASTNHILKCWNKDETSIDVDLHAPDAADELTVNQGEVQLRGENRVNTAFLGTSIDKCF